MGFFDRLMRKRGYIKSSEIQPIIHNVQVRAFEAAKSTNLFADWNQAAVPIDGTLKAQLTKLIARSRHLAHNDPYYKRGLQLLESNVVGSEGVALQARSIGKDNQLDTPANEAIENMWRDFSERENCDVTGKSSLAALARLFLRVTARDGDALVYVHKSNAYKYGIALEFIDAMCLDANYNAELDNGNIIRMGVELNRSRRPVAYHILTEAKNGDYYTHNNRDYRRLPADRVIHGYLRDDASQTRGYPWCVSSMGRSKMLDGYEEAEIVAARVAASKMGFFTSDKGDVQYQGEQNSDGSLNMDAAAGTFEQLPAGLQFQAFDPQHPTTAYDSFTKGVLRGISSGWGLSYHVFANDLTGVNYSSGRLGAQEDRELYKTLQNWIVDDFYKQVFKHLLPSALLVANANPNSGILSVSGRPLKLNRIEKYQRVSWQARRWQSVDPQKDTKANIDAIENRMKSRSSIIREDGRDPDEVFAEIEREEAMLREKGLLSQPNQEVQHAEPDPEDNE